MRKQYYSTPSDRGNLVWDVDRLVELSRHLPRRHVLLSDIKELDGESVEGGKPVTWRAFVEHMRLVQETDLAHPIILSASGAVMDGRHRVAKAVLEDREGIEAVQFGEDPPPDYVGVDLDDLPY